MAIDPASLYPTKTEAPSASWPYGGPRDVTVPGDGTGTPWTAAVISDLWAWQQALLARMGITPSGSPDTAAATEILDAVQKYVGITLETTQGALGFDLSEAPYFRTLAYSTAGDAGGSEWLATGNTVPGSAGTINWATGRLFDANGVEFSLASQYLRFEMSGLNYADIIAAQEYMGTPIYLLADRNYDLGSTPLVLGDGATLIGPCPGASVPTKLPCFVFAGFGPALTVTGGAAPRRDVTLQNFMIDSTGGAGISLELGNCYRSRVENLHIIGAAVYPDAPGMILVSGGEDITLRNIRIDKYTGLNDVGIYLAGTQGTRIFEPYFYNPGNENWTPITIQSDCVSTQVRGVTYSGAGTAAPISDDGLSTIYLDGLWHKSPHFDLAGSTQIGGSDTGRPGYINRARIVYAGTSAAGATPAAITLGKSIGGVFDIDYFLNLNSSAGYDLQTYEVPVIAFSNNSLAEGEMLLFRTAGGSEGGEIEIQVEVIPYRGRV